MYNLPALRHWLMSKCVKESTNNFKLLIWLNRQISVKWFASRISQPTGPSSKHSKDQKKVKTVKKTRDGKDPVMKSSDREELRTEKYNSSVAKTVKDLSINAINERAIGSTVKRIKNNVRDKRIEDPQVQLILKDRLANVRVKHEAKAKVKKYEDKGIADEFAEFFTEDFKDDIEDIPSVNHKELAVEVNQIIKTTITEVFKPRNKVKSQDISRSRDTKGTESHFSEIEELIPKPEPIKVQDKGQRVVREFSKEDSRALRDANNRRKAFKKAQKKERQADRKKGPLIAEVSEEKAWNEAPLPTEFPYVGNPQNADDRDSNERFDKFLRSFDSYKYAMAKTFDVNTMLDEPMINYDSLETAGHVLHSVILITRSKDFTSYHASLNYLMLSLFDKQNAISPFISRYILAKATWCMYNKMFKKEKMLIAEADDPEKKEHPLFKLGSLLEEGIDVSAIMFNGHAFTALQQLLTTVAAMHLLPKELAYKVYSVVGEHKGGKSMVELIQAFMKSLGLILKMSGRYLSGESAASILASENPEDFILEGISKLNMYVNNTYRGTPIAGRLCEFEWYKLYKEVVPKADVLKKKFNPLGSERRTLDTMLRNIHDYRDLLSVKGENLHRIAPMAWIISGRPGIGKSKLIDFTLAQHSLALGREYNPSLTFHRNKSPHWSGYDPLSQPYIHFSEIGNEKPSMMSVTGNVALAEMLSVVDSTPYNPPMAALRDKDKAWVKVEAVAIDGNFADLGIPTMFRNPGAYFRRFRETEATPKKEFTKADGQIDGAKCLASDSDYFDKWLFTVYEYEVTGNTRYKKVPVLENATCYDYAAYIRKVTIEHMAREQKNVDRMNDPATYQGYADGSHLDNVEEKMLPAEAKEVTPGPLNGGAAYQEIAEYLVHNFVFFLRSIFLSAVLSTILKYNRSLNNWIKGFLNLIAFYVMWFQLGIGFFASFIILTLLYFILEQSEDIVQKRNVQIALDAHSSNATASLTEMLRYVGVTTEQKVVTMKTFATARLQHAAIVSVAVASGVGILWSFYKSMEKSGPEGEGSTDFEFPSEYNEQINEIEKAVGANESCKRVPNKILHDWVNFREMELQNTHTSGPDNLAKLVHNNVREVIIRNGDVSRWNVKALGLRSNAILLNTHAMPDLKNFWIEVGNSTFTAGHNSYTKTFVNESNRVDLGNDMTIIWVSGMEFKDITKHILRAKNAENASFKSIPAVFNGSNTIAIKCGSKTATFRNKSFTVAETYQYQFASHAPGMCGIPLIGQVRHLSFILGIHFAGYHNSAECYAIMLDYAFIMDALNHKMPMLPIMNELQVTQSVLSQIDSGLLNAEAMMSKMSLDDPSEKSPTRYLKLDNMKYYGKIPGDVSVNNRSNLVDNAFTKASVSIEDQFYEVYGHVQKTVFGKPVMRPGNINGKWTDPFNIFLEKASKEKTSLDKNILRKCVDVYKEHVIGKIGDEMKVRDFAPLNLKTALNGAIEDCFIRKVDMKKAAGFGFNGKKASHVDVTQEEKFEPTEKLKKEIKRILTCYKEGNMAGFVYNAQLKDEPRDVEKIKEGKTRVFFASSFGSLVVSRMFMAPFYSLMVEHPEAFCTAIGIDMHRESGKVIDRMKFPNIMAGDYGSYDLTIPFDISWAATTFIRELCETFGYNWEALEYVRGILCDGLYPIICLNKDIFMIPGMQPSGKYATAEDNSLKGVILLLYAWYSHPLLKDKNFFDYVSPCTYGDDLGSGVHEETKFEFNDRYYEEFCKTNYNMTYTNSQKGKVVTPFVELKDFTFLKRSFIWSTELDRYISPLDMDSIMKTFTWRMASQSVTETDQITSMCTSMLYELWFHSNVQQYNKMLAWIRTTLLEVYGNDILPLCDKFPTYMELLNTFKQTPQITEVSGEDLPDCNDPLFKVRAEEFEEVAMRSMLKRLSILRERDGAGLDTPHYDILLSANKHDLLKFKFELVSRLDVLQEQKDLTEPQEHELEELQVTLMLIDKMLSQHGLLIAESGPEIEMKIGAIPASVMETHETLMEAGGNPAPEKDGEYPPHTILVDAQTDLQNFLRRPVEIFNGAVPLSTDYDQYLNPWNLFTTAQSVRAKLKNFAYIHANMHVRISLSGTPFHYGKLLVSYIPYAFYNPIIQAYGGNALLRYGMLQYSSQQKGAFTIDAKDNTPVDCMFPYMSPAPMARLHNGTDIAVGAATAFAGLSEMGELHIHSLNQFETVSSGVPTEIYMSIYAWMEDVKLGVPTATVIALTAESGNEMFSGPLSGKMAEASRMLKRFSSVPMIGSHANATSDMFRSLGAMSAALGFSKPVSATDPHYMKNEPFRNGANTTGMETLKRITLDPLQEVSLNYSDGKTEDEMSFAYLCARESLYTTFTWATTDTPTSGSIVAWGVNPMNTIPYYASLFRSYLQPSPLALCAMPHQYWRGRIKYRFEIVVSAFHRGKLAVVFEPNVSQYTLVSTTLKLNKQHTCIIDIQETQDFEFCVDMAFPREWCRVLGLQEGNVLDSKIPLTDPEALNGFVRVHAFTALQSPNSSSVSVNVYVSGVDMEFNRVSGVNIPTRKLMAESGLEQEQITCVDLNQKVTNDGNSAVRHFGERSTSFRSLLKRYASVLTDAWTGVLGDHSIRERIRSFPLPQPRVSTDPAACNVHWFHFVRQAYLGMRGGRKFRLFQYGIAGSDLLYAKVSLDPNDITDPAFGIANADDKSTSDGTVNYAFHTNFGVEYEVPFYENNLWVFANNSTPWPSNIYSVDKKGQRSHTIDLYFKSRTISDEVEYPFALDFAIAEDFNFLYFTGCPPYTADSIL